MRKFLILVIVIVVLFTLGIYGEKIATLTELAKPESITMDKDEIYVVEGATIFAYSTRDFKLLRKFGKQGQGPGEMIVAPNYSNKITLFPDHILVESLNKLVYFNREGKLLKEIKKTQFTILQTMPLGNNYVVNKMVFDQKEKKVFHCIALHNAELKEIRELYRMNFMQQGQPPNGVIDMLFDYPTVRIYNGKIFIEESADGFIIEIFNREGKKLNRIQKNYRKIKVSQKYKDEVINRLKGDQLIKVMGGWLSFKKLFKLHFPDTFPPIQGIEVSQDKIFVQTYKEVDNKYEFIVMNFQGQILKRIFLPKFRNVSLAGSILGTKLHLIRGNYLFYLLEDEEDEEWHLYKEKLKV